MAGGFTPGITLSGELTAAEPDARLALSPDGGWLWSAPVCETRGPITLELSGEHRIIVVGSGPTTGSYELTVADGPPPDGN